MALHLRLTARVNINIPTILAITMGNILAVVPCSLPPSNVSTPIIFHRPQIRPVLKEVVVLTILLLRAMAIPEVRLLLVHLDHLLITMVVPRPLPVTTTEHPLEGTTVVHPVLLVPHLLDHFPMVILMLE